MRWHPLGSEDEGEQPDNLRHLLGRHSESGDEPLAPNLKTETAGPGGGRRRPTAVGLGDEGEIYYGEQPPTFVDLTLLMERSCKLGGRRVSYCWATEDADFENLVRVRCKSLDNDASWTLEKSKIVTGKVISTYLTSDVENLYKVITMGLESLSVHCPPASVDPPHDPIGASVPISGTEFSAHQPSVSVPAEGSLEITPVLDLLQSVKISSMTGLMTIRSGTNSAKVFFNSGVPIHCEADGLKGDQALLELMIWTSGKFEFCSRKISCKRSITMPLEVLMIESCTYLSLMQSLEDSGFNKSCYLRQVMPVTGEDELLKCTEAEPPIEIQDLRDFLELIDGTLPAPDLFKRESIPKTKWIPIVHSLVHGGVLEIVDHPVSAPVAPWLADACRLGESVECITEKWLLSSTGVLAYPAFLLFLRQQVQYFEQFRMPFSLIVFSFGYRRRNRGPLERPSSEIIRRVMVNVQGLIGAAALLGQFEGDKFAVILPNSDTSRAIDITKQLKKNAFIGKHASDPKEKLASYFGIASFPEHCDSVELLMARSEASCDRSKRTGSIVVNGTDL